MMILSVMSVAKFLRLKASWQEKELRKIAKNTIIFVDEPYMATFGSVTMNLSRGEGRQPAGRGLSRAQRLKGSPLLRQHRLVGPSRYQILIS